MADITSYYQPESRNSCDIGSVELMKLTSGDLEDVSNISLTTLIDTYQQNYDLFDNYIKDPKTPYNFITYYKVRLAEFKTYLIQLRQILNIAQSILI